MDKIPDLVVVAGPNGCGKTSIFEAIRVFKALLGPYHPSEIGLIRGELRNQLGNLVNLKSDNAEISLSFEISQSEISYLKKMGFNIDEELATNNGLLQGTLKITKTGDTQLVSNPPSLQEILRHYDPTDELGTITYIPGYREIPVGDIGNITLSTNWLEEQKIASTGNVRAKFSQLKQNFAMMRIYDLIHVTENAASFISQVQSVFQNFFYPKEFKGVEVDKSLTWHFPIKHPAGTHDIDFLSSGEKEILMTYTEILKLKLTGSIILFDEPDLHLNAALERKVIISLQQIVKSGNQIWVATHSLEIIGTVSIGSLYKMYAKTSPTQKNQVELCSEKSGVLDLFKNLGASVGIQLISEKIVYVEGPSDTEILRTFYSEHSDRLSFIETRGVNGIIGLSQAVGELLNEAANFESFLMLRDRDFLSEDERNEVHNKYNGRVHVWSKRTIENLLLDEEIIFNVFSSIGLKLTNSVDVQNMLKDTANKLKLTTITDMAKEKLYQLFNRTGFGIASIHSDDIVNEILANVKPQRDDLVQKLQNSEIEKLIIDCKKTVEDDWDSNWKVLCDGKKILQGLIDNYLTPQGKNMKLSAFRSLIVNQMKKENKIPPEINDFFKTYGFESVSSPELKKNPS